MPHDLDLWLLYSVAHQGIGLSSTACKELYCRNCLFNGNEMAAEKRATHQLMFMGFTAKISSAGY